MSSKFPFGQSLLQFFLLKPKEKPFCSSANLYMD